MGNSVECGFSNATEFDVKFQLHSDTKVITKSEKELGGKANLSVGGEYAGFGGKVGVGGELNYKTKEEAEYYLVDPDFKGYTTVNRGTRLDLKDHPCAQKGESAYITIIVLYDNGGRYVHTLNFPVTAASCNYMLGTNIDGRFERVKLHEKRIWRAKGTDGTQNYYGNRVCNGCGRQLKCKRDCTDLAEFGGHKE